MYHIIVLLFIINCYNIYTFNVIEGWQKVFKTEGLARGFSKKKYLSKSTNEQQFTKHSENTHFYQCKVFISCMLYCLWRFNC